MKTTELKVLVTGSHGLIGSAFVDFLKKKNIPYLRYNRKDPKAFTTGFNAVVHLAGLTPHSKRVKDETAEHAFYKAHVENTKELLAVVARNPDLQRFVHIGSFAEYGLSSQPVSEKTKERPVGAYGESKLKESLLIQAFARKCKIKTIQLRVANVIAQANLSPRTPRLMRMSLFQNLASQFAKKQTPLIISISHPNDIRDYVDIEDVKKAILSALLTPRGGMHEIINICSGRGISNAAIVRTYGRLLHKSYKLKSTAVKPTVSIGIPRKAKKLLGWTPRGSFTQGLKNVVRTPRSQ